MKKILFATCLSVLLSVSGSAQVQAVVAPGVASISSENDREPIFGAMGGIQFPLTRFGASTLLAGVMMAYQGAKFSNADVKQNFIYAYAPLVMQFLLANKLYGQAGLVPGLLLSAKEKFNNNSYDVKDHFNSFE